MLYSRYGSSLELYYLYKLSQTGKCKISGQEEKFSEKL